MPDRGPRWDTPRDWPSTSDRRCSSAHWYSRRRGNWCLKKAPRSASRASRRAEIASGRPNSRLKSACTGTTRTTGRCVRRRSCCRRRSRTGRTRRPGRRRCRIPRWCPVPATSSSSRTSDSASTWTASGPRCARSRSATGYLEAPR